MNQAQQAPVALITGSGRKRVGNEIALDLAERGYSVALHYHSSEEEACESVGELRNLGAECEAYQADVADEAEVNQMFDAVRERFGRLDALVTTASIWSSKTLEDVTADDVRKNFDINCLGTYLCARRAGLIMVEQKRGGSIITIGDWAIERPYVDHSAYFVSKGAIPTLTRVLAVELGQRNPKVRVNCIHPGPVMFPPNTSEAEQQELIDSTLVRNADCPDEVARAVRFLIENEFVTGVCLPVDGGKSIYTPDSVKRSI